MEYRESKVSCPRTQNNVPARTQTWTARSGLKRTDHEATAPPLFDEDDDDVVSFAAVFWDVTQRSPQRNGCSHPNNIPFSIVFVVCLRSVQQTNHITTKCERRKLSRGNQDVTDNLASVRADETTKKIANPDCK